MNNLITICKDSRVDIDTSASDRYLNDVDPRVFAISDGSRTLNVDIHRHFQCDSHAINAQWRGVIKIKSQSWLSKNNNWTSFLYFHNHRFSVWKMYPPGQMFVEFFSKLFNPRTNGQWHGKCSIWWRHHDTLCCDHWVDSVLMRRYHQGR